MLDHLGRHLIDDRLARPVHFELTVLEEQDAVDLGQTTREAFLAAFDGAVTEAAR